MKDFSRKRSNQSARALGLPIGMPQRRASLGREAIRRSGRPIKRLGVSLNEGLLSEEKQCQLVGDVGPVSRASTKGFSRKRSNRRRDPACPFP